MAVIDGLTSYWSSDEAGGNPLLDAHGGRNLAETGGTIASAVGKVAGCRNYVVADGRYFATADDPAFSPGASSFTFALWTQLRSTGADRTMIGKYLTTTNQREYFLLYNNTSSRFEFRATDTGASSPSFSVFANSFGAPALNTWYYLVGGRDAALGQLFISVNGGTVDTAAMAPAVFNGTGQFQIGALGNAAATLLWDGLMDEIGYWGTKRLSAAEISFLYNAGNGVSYADIVAQASGGGGMLSPRVLGDSWANGPRPLLGGAWG